jgi:hypothetical protein
MGANLPEVTSKPGPLVPLIEAPLVKNIDELIQFDRFIFESNQLPDGIRRRCLPLELPPGLFEKLSKIGPDVFVYAMKTGPGCITKMVATGRLRDPNAPMAMHAIIQEHYESYRPEAPLSLALN